MAQVVGGSKSWSLPPPIKKVKNGSSPDIDYADALVYGVHFIFENRAYIGNLSLSRVVTTSPFLSFPSIQQLAPSTRGVRRYGSLPTTFARLPVFLNCTGGLFPLPRMSYWRRLGIVCTYGDQHIS